MAGLEAKVNVTGTVPPMMRFDWLIELEKSIGGAPPGELHGAGGDNRFVHVTALSLQSCNTLCKLNHRFVEVGDVTNVNVRAAEVTIALLGILAATWNLSKARLFLKPSFGPVVPESSVRSLPSDKSRLFSEIVASSAGISVKMSASAIVAGQSQAALREIPSTRFSEFFKGR